MGDINLVRPLALAGITSVLAAPASDPARFSRHVRELLAVPDAWARPDAYLETLCAFAAREPEPPVLVFQSDAELLLVSRHRERLAPLLRFVLADAGLVEALVDKDRFIDVAHEHELPLPATARLGPADAGAELHVPLPAVVKPLTRSPRWHELEPSGKAVVVRDAATLERVRGRLAALGVPALVQELVPGPERLIESYHAYVDGEGTVAGEFTGRKIRTWPQEFGFSTAVEITDVRDVRDVGRDVVRRIGLRGVAKADFKRAPDGSLKLLEINPRFNLWHYPGAVAGVNLPALVAADLTGAPRPASGPVRTGVTWCQPLQDLRAARDEGEPLARWARFFTGCDARSTLSPDDPMPFVRGRVLASAGRALRRR